MTQKRQSCTVKAKFIVGTTFFDHHANRMLWASIFNPTTGADMTCHRSMVGTLEKGFPTMWYSYELDQKLENVSFDTVVEFFERLEIFDGFVLEYDLHCLNTQRTKKRALAQYEQWMCIDNEDFVFVYDPNTRPTEEQMSETLQEVRCDSQFHFIHRITAYVTSNKTTYVQVLSAFYIPSAHLSGKIKALVSLHLQSIGLK